MSAPRNFGAMTPEDVFFLIGVACGPYLDGLTELPSGLLDIARRLSESMHDTGMAARCAEIAEHIKKERAK